jgi:hypothetical protein
LHHILSLERRVVHIIQDPIGGLAHDWCPIIVAQRIKRCTSLSSFSKYPLPDGMEYNAKADGVGQGNGLPSDKFIALKLCRDDELYWWSPNP